MAEANDPDMILTWIIDQGCPSLGLFVDHCAELGVGNKTMLRLLKDWEGRGFVKLHPTTTHNTLQTIARIDATDAGSKYIAELEERDEDS